MGSERGELTRALAQRVVDAKSGDSSSLSEDFVDRAIQLAVARTGDERAWALTRIAAVLRRAGRFDDALRVLDVADSLRPSQWPERAVYTCAIAVHCDRGDFAMARALGEEQLGRSFDVELLRPVARALHAIFMETEDPADEARWRDMKRRIEAAEALEVAV